MTNLKFQANDSNLGIAIHKGSISQTYLLKLLCVQIPKVQKYNQVSSVNDQFYAFLKIASALSFALSGSGLNLINVLRTAFTLVDPESIKRYWQLDWVLTLWGAAGVKAVCRTLMKSSPDRVKAAHRTLVKLIHGCRREVHGVLSIITFLFTLGLF